MDTSASASVTSRPVRPASPRDRTRLWATLAALLFVPPIALIEILILTSERAGLCIAYGEQCATSGLPDWMFEWSVRAAPVALLGALVAPVIRMRRVALAAQLLAEGTALLFLFSHA